MTATQMRCEFQFHGEIDGGAGHANLQSSRAMYVGTMEVCLLMLSGVMCGTTPRLATDM